PDPILSRPFRAEEITSIVFPGRCPGLYYCRPSGGGSAPFQIRRVPKARPHTRILRLALSLTRLTFHVSCFTQAQPATNAPTLRDEWVDPDTGHRIIRLSRLPGSSQSFYFHQNAWTTEGDKLVFENSPPGATNRLVVLDWKTRKITPLTEPGSRGIVVGP